MLHAKWVEIPNADQLSDVQTEAAADAAGAFGFVRIEDGEFRPNAKREFWFVTTGDQAARPEADPHTNELGRLYRLRFDGRDPLAGATLTQTYNADQLTPAQDGPLSPDNLDVSKRFVAINEDGTGGGAPGGTGSRDDMAARNRDGSIWIVPLATAGDPATFKRVAELVGRTEGGRDNIPTVGQRHLGDQRDRRRPPRVRAQHVPVRRAGARAHHAARRQADHGRGRAVAAPAAAAGRRRGQAAWRQAERAGKRRGRPAG